MERLEKRTTQSKQAHPQVKMKDVPSLDFVNVIHRTATVSMTQWFNWKAICTAAAGKINVGTNIGRHIAAKRLGKGQKLGSIEKANFFLSVLVDDTKMVDRRESLAPMRANLHKKFELEDPTTLDQVYLGCTQRAATVDEETIRTTTEMFHRITVSNVKEFSKVKQVTILKKFRHGSTT